MRTIGPFIIIASFVAGCAASRENRATAPAPVPPRLEAAAGPKPAPLVAPPPVVQAPRLPSTRPTTAPAVAARRSSAPSLKPQPSAPPDYRQYLLQTSGNWWLRVDRDGGGAYGYGSAPEDRATFRAGTFDFLKLGRTLHEKMASDAAAVPDATAVTLSPRKGIPNQGVIAESRYIRSLFDTAKARRHGDLAQLDHIESSFPILP